jgi:hypothetical protein
MAALVPAMHEEQTWARHGAGHDAEEDTMTKLIVDGIQAVRSREAGTQDVTDAGFPLARE